MISSFYLLKNLLIYFRDINMNYRNSNEFYNIHYEEIFSQKRNIIKFLQNQTAEIKNSNYYLAKSTKKTQEIIPPGIDLILKKKNNMKFDGFYLIYDEEIE